MLRTSVLLLLLFALPGLFGQEQESGVIVLKDGRMVAIQGDLQIFDTEIHFTDSQGRLMTLPTSKVDLEETERRNELIKQGKTEDLARKNPSERGPIIYKPPPKPPPEPEVEAEEQAKSPADLDGRFQRLMEDFESMETNGFAYSDWDGLRDSFGDGFGPWYGTLTTIGAGFLLFSLLIHAMTRIWILFLAFQDSGTWFMIIICSSILSFGISVLYSPVVAAFLDLLGMAAVFLFVMLHCYGRRFLLLFLYFSPIIVSFLFGAIAVGMAFFVG